MSVFGPTSYKDQLPAYLGKLLRLHFALTFALALLLALGATYFLSFFGNRSVAYALFGAGLATPWILFLWLSRRTAYLELRPALAVRSAAVYCLLVLLLLFLFQQLGWLSPVAAFLLQALASLAAGALLLAFIRPQLRPLRSNPSMQMVLKQHWQYGRWVVATAFVYWLSCDAYYVVVAVLLPLEDVAALRALQNFILPMTHFMTEITLSLLPWSSAQFVERGGAVLERSTRRITLLLLSGGAAYLVCIVLFGHWLMQTLYAGRYTQFAYLISLVGLPVLLRAASQGPAIALRAMQAPIEVFWGYAVAGVSTILAGVALTYFYGLLGAVVGIVVSSSAFLVAIRCRYQARIKRITLVEPCTTS